MFARSKVRFAALLFASPVLFALVGCVQTKIGVALDPTGGGTRSIEISWEVDTLEDLELSDEDLRGLLDLDPKRGWTSRREDRMTDGGSSRPHLVFARETSFTSVAAWAEDGADLSVRVAPGHPARLLDEVRVEVGAGAGYRTLEYRETFDARSVKDLLDRYVADQIAQAVSRAQPALEDWKLAELRGLFRAHLFHLPSIVMDDDENEEAREEFTAIAAPQAAWIVKGDVPTSDEIDAMQQRLEDIFDGESPDFDGYLEHEVPGISLLAFMNLDFEISMPGRIVETNADRSGDGFAAWERPVWPALQTPIVIHVRSRIDE